MAVRSRNLEMNGNANTSFLKLHTYRAYSYKVKGQGHKVQWRRFVLEIGVESAEGASVERSSRADRGAKGAEGVVEG